MDKKQSAGINTFSAVQTVFRAHNATVQRSRALKKAAEELNHLILDADIHVKIQSSRPGMTESKAQARRELGDVVYEVAGSLLALAHATDDVNLAARVAYSRSVITAGSTNAVLARCQAILDVANEHVESPEQ